MHVKATDKIWNEIEVNITAMFHERSLHASNWETHGIDMTTLQARCWASAVTPEQIAMIDALGDKFFSRYDDVQLRIKHKSVGGVINTYTDVRVPFTPPRLMPAKWYGWDSDARPVVTDPEIIAIAEKREVAIHAINAERTAFVERAKQAYKQCSSINQLVKLWPAARDLLDKDVRDKLDAKPARTKPEDMGIDTALISHLQVDMLKARVAQ